MCVFTLWPGCEYTNEIVVCTYVLMLLRFDFSVQPLHIHMTRSNVDHASVIRNCSSPLHPINPFSSLPPPPHSVRCNLLPHSYDKQILFHFAWFTPLPPSPPPPCTICLFTFLLLFFFICFSSAVAETLALAAWIFRSSYFHCSCVTLSSKFIRASVDIVRYFLVSFYALTLFSLLSRMIIYS